MLLHAEAFRDLGLFPAIVRRRLQKHLQNGKPLLPAAVAAITTFALESDAGGEGEELVPLASSANLEMEPEPDDGGQQDVLVSLLDELLVDEPPPPTSVAAKERVHSSWRRSRRVPGVAGLALPVTFRGTTFRCFCLTTGGHHLWAAGCAHVSCSQGTKTKKGVTKSCKSKRSGVPFLQKLAASARQFGNKDDHQKVLYVAIAAPVADSSSTGDDTKYDQSRAF